MPTNTSFKNLNQAVKIRLAALNYRLMSRGNKLPRTLFLSLTYRCQLNCVHCRYAQNPAKGVSGGDISLKLARNILLQAATMKIPRVIMFGGEPTLHPDIEKIVQEASSLGLFVEMDTNGLKLNKNFVNSLKAAGLSAIRLSLHSHLPQKHNKTERANSFEKVKKAVKIGLKAGLLVYLSSCQSKSSLHKDDMENLIKLAEKWSVHGIRILGYVSEKSSSNTVPVKLSNKINKLKIKGFAQTCIQAPQRNNVCAAQRNELLFIGPDGKIKLCPYSNKVFGNASKQKLSLVIQKIFKTKPAKLPCLK